MLNGLNYFPPHRYLDISCSLTFENKPLSKMWTKDAIKRWIDSLDDPSAEFIPDEVVANTAPSVRLPGEACYACTRKRVDMLDIMRPLYESIFEKFEGLGGKRTGIVVGLIPSGGDPIAYFEVPALMKKPVKILFSRLYPTGDMDYVADICDAFYYPKQAKLSVPTQPNLPSR